MIKRQGLFSIAVCALTALLLFGPTIVAAEVNYTVHKTATGSQAPQPVAEQANRGDYQGRLRIYVVEQVSTHYFDYYSQPYEFCFMDFAYNMPITLAYQETFTDTVTWSGEGTEYDDITEGNIMVMAVMFNSEAHRSYSDPPDQFPFDAYYVDATAAATTTEQWSNATTEPGFTHTVFVEEGTSEG
ncbi:MAG: hypothetical protein JSV44_03210 [Candidatus Zixiibacteriota bacterium]|nr:MAG: hypothetical protein JSV44_03210 [candidate division Zixibacteria bacterium]